ncbi:MAG: HlyD family efflux transporter periplasmic adaptor subunit [Planctomycetota bacterium]
MIPGVVSPYRQNPLSFEVPGRVIWLLEVGDDVEGARIDETGGVVVPGTVLAKLEPEPYERALTQSEKRLASARAQLTALSAQLEQVLPSRVASARASAAAAEEGITFAQNDLSSRESALDLARTTLQKNEELLPSGSVSDLVVRESRTEVASMEARLAQARTLVTTRRREHEAALAAVAEAEGAVVLQGASVDAQAARIAELEQQLLEAQSDLEDCILRAPFGGRVTAVHVGEGSVVQAGTSIVTLTMMTPIEVELTVSSSLEKALVLGSDAVIYPMDGASPQLDRGLPSTIFQKPGVANSRSSTFTVGLITTNQRSNASPTPDGLPTSPYLVPVLRNPLDIPGDEIIYTMIEALGEESGQTYALRVNDVQQGSRTADTLTQRLTATRVAVRRGPSTLKFAGFTLVELQPTEDLGPSDLLVGQPTLQHTDGFFVTTTRWVLRPGDLVQVSLDRPSLSKGFYLPVQSIQEINGETFVFMVQDGRAVKVPVTVRDSSGERRRVEAPQLQPGASIVTDGSHYLRDGDLLRVVNAKGGSNQ